MNRSEIKLAFETKYDEQIKTISKEKEVDMGVARDILIAHVRNSNKTINEISNPAYFYNFTGCENLKYGELEEDIKVLEDNFIVPKVID